MNKTKIICSIGPSSAKSDIIREMLINGMNVARFEMGQYNMEFIKSGILLVRRLSRELSKPCGIMLDTTGPELRLGTISNGSIYLMKGNNIKLCNYPVVGTQSNISISTDEFDKIEEDKLILFSSSRVVLRVVNIENNYAECIVEESGYLFSHDIVHIDGFINKRKYVLEKDIKEIEFAIAVKADFLALSNIRNNMDVLDINDELIKLDDGHIQLISKIETTEAIEDFDNILSSSDGIMISRGDLGFRMPIEKLPAVQKKLIKETRKKNKISIVSTEILSSMEYNKVPTRAEVSDVYNAVLELTDALSLTGETSIGENPIESVIQMREIINSCEEEIDYKQVLINTEDDYLDITSSIARSATLITDSLDIKGIITSTFTGYTAKRLSMYRPKCPVIATVPNKDVVSSLTLYYGIVPVYTNRCNTTDEIIANCRTISIEQLGLKSKDLVIITGSIPAKEDTNFMKVEEI